MFTIDSFESYIPALILQRGRQYFESDAVDFLEEGKRGHWKAQVAGNELYDVEVVLSGKKVFSSTCDCPYDGGPVCKHVVAVLYALREQNNAAKIKPAKSRSLNFEDLLLKPDIEELRDFIRHCQEENREFGEKFMLFFADKNPQMDVAAKYEGLIRQMVRRHSSRGFMDYRQSFAFSKEIRSVLLSAEQLLDRKNYHDAWLVGQALCKEVFPVLQACDDSAGNIGYVLSHAIATFERIAQSPTVSRELLTNLFEYLEKLLSDKTWFEFGDFGYELLGVAEEIAGRVAPDRFLSLLDNLIKTHTGPYSDYRQNNFRTAKIRFLESIGREQEAAALIAQNLDLVEVRRGEMEKAIAKQDYAGAKALIAGGIKVAEEKKHPGTVHQWEEALLRIARLENDIETVRRLSKQFALDRGVNQEYYAAWKASYTPAEWPQVIEAHIQSVIDAETAKPRTYKWDSLDSALYMTLSPIYILEEQWERLLRIVPESPGESVLNTIHPHLAKRYPRELLALYLPLLEKMGDEASSRNEYRHLADLMKKVRQDIEGSHGAIDELAVLLIRKYPRRPAMTEELGRVLKR